MKAFLYNIAEAFFNKYGQDLYKQTFVFPNRRAGVFFQKYLAEIANEAIFSPNIITIQELFGSLSPLRQADKIDLLVLFYEQYQKISNTSETLDDFLFWGEILLNDFSDVDKYMVDARQLFQNITNLKDMDHDLTYLSEEQIKAIQQFWSNFNIDNTNETKGKFLETWQILLELYNSFRDSLYSKGLAYEGMLFRDVAEKAKKKDELTINHNNLVFVGLNALTPAETTLLEYLKNKNIADFYWDYDTHFVRDNKNRASYWVKENETSFPSGLEYNKQVKQFSNEKKNTTLIGVPSGVGQAKIVSQILKDLIEKDQITAENSGLTTAIVLPDENMLIPVLYSIPEDIEKINVTMGYSLQQSAIASLISSISSMQHNMRNNDKETTVYYKFVLAILNHPLVSKHIGKTGDRLKDYILKNNRVMLSLKELDSNTFLKLIFTPINHWSEASDYLRNVLTTIYNNLTIKRSEDKENQNDTRVADIELEFIVQYYKTINRLQDSLHAVNEMSVESYFRLLKQLSQSISISFQGEPLSGLQVMGILETRALDFENIIILSMNEGVFPLKRPTNSFIPHTLRQGFNLPTYEHQDSTYAYHFYRMISRAKNIYMLYDTRAEDMQSGEVSRYFYQMKYLYDNYFDIEEVMVNYNVSATRIDPVSIEKTPEVMRKLQEFKEGGTKSFSASNINNYLNCPLQFYLTTVEGLSEEDEVQESIEASVFGTIYHAVIQNIYDRYKGQEILPDTLNAIIKDKKYVTKLIEEAFAKHYFKQEERVEPLTGYHYLIAEILHDYIKQTLHFDKQFTPFQYIDSEHRFNIQHKASNTLSVNIKGSIDRIDKHNDTLRVIDYKTGKGDLNFTEIEDMFDPTKRNRKSHILQVFFYALAYNYTDTPLSPGIYYLREIFKDNFDPRINHNKTHINNIEYLMHEFISRLNILIEEIFNPNIPFSQTTNTDICKWCTFKDVCRR